MVKLLLLVTVAVGIASANAGRLRPVPETFIFGGKEVDIADYGWQVSLEVDDYHRCGAVILNEFWALTSVRCVEGLEPSDITLLVGTSDKRNGGTRHTAYMILIHPEFSKRTMDNDVALIRVATPCPLNGGSVRAAILPEVGADIPAGTTVTATGWGFTEEHGWSNDHLLGVNIPIIDLEVCRENHSFYAGIGAITVNNICAGLPEEGKNVCSGDYGGPLVDQDGTLVGVASWGEDCRYGKPTVFVKVSAPQVRDFINEIVGV